MKNTNLNSQSVFDRLFANLTLEEKNTFTPTQINALQAASSRLTWKRHMVDLRVSIPFPAHPGFYIVILGGSEQRSAERACAQRRLFWQSVGLIGGTAVFAGLSWFGIVRLLPQLDNARYISPHSTVLPWIDSKADCVGAGKVWQDGECWDAQHSPLF